MYPSRCSVSAETQKDMLAPPAGTAISRVRRLYETSPIWEYTYFEPVCGENGPPGRSYRPATQLSNCGNSSAGRSPLVVMKDAVSNWFVPSTPKEDPVEHEARHQGQHTTIPNRFMLVSPVRLRPPKLAAIVTSGKLQWRARLR